jgi:hypothetical protein
MYNLFGVKIRNALRYPIQLQGRLAPNYRIVQPRTYELVYIGTGFRNLFEILCDGPVYLCMSALVKDIPMEGRTQPATVTPYKADGESSRHPPREKVGYISSPAYTRPTPLCKISGRSSASGVMEGER